MLTELFRHYVFRALRKARRINDVTIQRMLTWLHSGFNWSSADIVRERSWEAELYLIRHVLRLSAMEGLPSC